jgi:hypothetical protein
MRYLRPTAVAMLVSCGVILSSCGITPGSGGANSATMTKARQRIRTPAQIVQQALQQQRAAIARREAALPTPTPGLVTVATEPYLGSSNGVQVQLQTTPVNRAFSALCSGRVDIVEADSLASQSDLDSCPQNGIKVLSTSSGQPEPIELAADGIVVASKNGADVGGDCLPSSTVRDIFQAGSPLTNWTQVGFDDLPLTTAGRSSGTTLALFGSLVLGAQGTTRLSDLRSDFKAEEADSRVRDDVTQDAAIAGATTAAQRQLDRELHSKSAVAAKQAASNAAVVAANNAFLRAIAAENARLKRQKKTLTAGQQQAISNQHLVQINKLKAAAASTGAKAYVQRIVKGAQSTLDTRIAALESLGTFGFFRFTYYELYEDKLRPMEIWDPIQAQSTLESSGVATSLSSSAEVTKDATEVRPDGQISSVATTSFPTTPDTAGSSFTTGGGDKVTVPPNGPVNLATTPDCIFPSQDTITSGIYPYSVRLLAYTTTRALKRAEVRNYLGFYVNQGQTIVSNDRLVPLNNRVRETEYQAVTGKALKLAGTTSSLPGTSSGSSAQANTSVPSASGAVPGVGSGG